MDAGTLNCPDCGAAVPANGTECEFCHARLATIGCEKCFGMVFVGSKHCQHCGAVVKDPSDRNAPPLACPRHCGEMRAVRFGGADMWECRTCSGLWADRETVERLIAERLRPAPLIGTGLPQAKPEPVPVQPVKYAACPKCAKVMNRVNFGRTSGIIVDVCSHGTWFDADEMRRVLEYVAAGGLEAARARELSDAREAAAMRPTPADPSIFTNEIRHVRGSLGEGSVLSILVSYTRSRKGRLS